MIMTKMTNDNNYEKRYSGFPDSVFSFYQWYFWTSIGLRINLDSGLRRSGTQQSPPKE